MEFWLWMPQLFACTRARIKTQINRGLSPIILQRAFRVVGAVVLSGGVRLVGGIGTLAQGAVLLGVAPAGGDQGAFFNRRAWRCRCQG